MSQELKIKIRQALIDGVHKGLITQEQAEELYDYDPDIIRELKKLGE